MTSNHCTHRQWSIAALLAAAGAAVIGGTACARCNWTLAP